MNKKNIFLVRHARQNSKLCNANVNLSEQGKMQAQLLGYRLENYGIEVVYSSGLARAIETAEIINKHISCKHIIKENLKEIDYGELTNQTEQYIKENFYNFTEERWKMLSDLPFPGGENGKDVIRRVAPIFQEIEKSKEQCILVVTHGGTIRSVLAHYLGLDLEKKLRFGINLENCGITHLMYDIDNDRYFLERFNDFAHLEGKSDLLRNNW